jgi:hypothetical protein
MMACYWCGRMMNGQVLPARGFRWFAQKYENLLKNCVKVKN